MLVSHIKKWFQSFQMIKHAKRTQIWTAYIKFRLCLHIYYRIYLTIQGLFCWSVCVNGWSNMYSQHTWVVWLQRLHFIHTLSNSITVLHLILNSEDILHFPENVAAVYTKGDNSIDQLYINRRVSWCSRIKKAAKWLKGRTSYL